MGLFRRFSDIISANLNDLVDRFEEPEKMLKQAMREMEASIAEATAATATAIASEKLLAKDVIEHEQHVQRWQARAETAIKATDHERARQALVQKRSHERLTQALRDQLTAAQTTVHALRSQLEAMKAKHREAKQKLATLQARSNAAKARAHWQSALPTMDPYGAGYSRFDRMKEKIELAEAESDALAQLGGLELNLQAIVYDMSEQDSDIDAELAALKQKLDAASVT